jgi:hypothetical protein
MGKIRVVDLDSQRLCSHLKDEFRRPGGTKLGRRFVEAKSGLKEVSALRKANRVPLVSFENTIEREISCGDDPVNRANPANPDNLAGIPSEEFELAFVDFRSLVAGLKSGWWNSKLNCRP